MYLPDHFLYAVRLACGETRPSIIHIGGHTGEEAELYATLRPSRVFWVEANEELRDKLWDHLSHFTNHGFSIALVSDKDGEEVDFHISNNTHCSSMLQMKDHKEIYPDYHHVKSVKMRTITLDTLAKNVVEKKDPLRQPFNVLMMDVQGSENLVIAGGTETLKGIQVIATEINFREMYEGVPLAAALDEQLFAHGFVRWVANDTGCGWGDAIYLRKEKMVIS